MNIQDFSPSPEQEIQFLLLRKIDIEFESRATYEAMSVYPSQDTLRSHDLMLRTKKMWMQDRIDELLSRINSSVEPVEREVPKVPDTKG